MKKLKLKENQKLLIGGIFLFIAMLAIVGYTYSFFQVEDKDTGTITGTVASASLEIEVNKLAPSTNKGLVPQLDDYITAAVVGRNNLNCVDDNSNEVCQVYSIKVTNTGSSSINVDGLVELNANNNPNLKWAEISTYTQGMTTRPELKSNVKTHSETDLTTNELYEVGDIKTYYIVIWISETNYVQPDTGEFTGVVTFRNHEEPEPPALTTLTNLNLTSSLRTDTPNFAKASYSTCTSTDCETTVGIYEAEDDLGTSYYFRGDVENNYVLFDNKYWRIIRINGDGSIRMIYDGTTPHENGESSTDRRVTTKVFNTKYADNAFVGYMNGTTDGTNFPNGTTTSSSYEEAHTNTTDSTIKDYLENTWYEGISEANKAYIVDAIYCNDREVSTADSSYTGDGSAKTITAYKAYERLYVNRNNAQPVLTCSQENDRFTLESTNFEIETNGKLDAPVGLITADEMVLAGGTRNTINIKYYLYSGNYYWTMSPYYFSNPYKPSAAVFNAVGDGSLSAGGVGSTVNDNDVRPVISLNADALKYGTGVIGDEFRITE